MDYNDATLSKPTVSRQPARGRKLLTTLSGSTFLIGTLAASAAFGVNKGCVQSPFDGSAVVFSSSAANGAINLEFSGQGSTGAGNVRVVMGKYTAANTLGSTVVLPSSSMTPDANDYFDKTFAVRRDGLSGSTAAGTAIWAENDVVGFAVQELISGTWTNMETYSPQSGQTPAPGIVAVSDRANASSFPSNTPPSGATGLAAAACSTSLPLPAGKFFCPNPFTAFPSQGNANFLSRRGVGSATEAGKYYANFPAAEQYATLVDFRSKNHFSSDPTSCKTSSATENCAWYRNENDLGFGRQMHCRVVSTTAATGAASKVACYVSNFINEEDSYNAAKATAPIATVAMVWLNNPTNKNGTATKDYIRFYVFGGNGSLATTAQLDGATAKAVPNLCLNCHGGSYDATNHQALGTHFLAFDQAYLPTASAKDDQTANFLALNRRVAETEVSSIDFSTNPVQPTPIEQLIGGWYGGNLSSTGTFDTAYVPGGWSKHERLYLNVVAPYCRSCHEAQPEFRSWSVLGEFTNFANTTASGTKTLVCNATDELSMPDSQRMHQRFWESGAPAVLTAEIGPFSSSNGCKFHTRTTDNTFNFSP